MRLLFLNSIVLFFLCQPFSVEANLRKNTPNMCDGMTKKQLSKSLASKLEDFDAMIASNPFKLSEILHDEILFQQKRSILCSLDNALDIDVLSQWDENSEIRRSSIRKFVIKVLDKLADNITYKNNIHPVSLKEIELYLLTKIGLEDFLLHELESLRSVEYINSKDHDLYIEAIKKNKKNSLHQLELLVLEKKAGEEVEEKVAYISNHLGLAGAGYVLYRALKWTIQTLVNVKWEVKTPVPEKKNFRKKPAVVRPLKNIKLENSLKDPSPHVLVGDIGKVPLLVPSVTKIKHEAVVVDDIEDRGADAYLMDDIKLINKHLKDNRKGCLVIKNYNIDIQLMCNDPLPEEISEESRKFLKALCNRVKSASQKNIELQEGSDTLHKWAGL